ncbi:MAG: response regulator [Betaproteobacteria bacterium]|nr:response regulator [Betaproteobacteria bacterium]
MIYIVDEDVVQLRPYAIELEIRGYEVKQIDNADAAYELLRTADNIELALIDVMLSAESVEKSIFSRERTGDFIKTGLVLFEELTFANPKYFPGRAAFLSMGTMDWLVKEITGVSEKYKVPYLRKRDYRRPMAFGDKVESLINNNLIAP